MTFRGRPPALVALSPGDLARSPGGAVRSTGDHLAARDLVRVVDACVRAGLRGFLLREPALSDRETLELARALRDVIGDGWLAVHDRVHLAAACRADAVHVGFRSLRPEAARALVDPGVGVGFSAHATDDPILWAACDYVFFGPVFDTPSKRGLVDPVGFEGLARAVRSTSVGVWGLGGLVPEHVPGVVDAGAGGLAVLGGITRSADPASACGRYLAALREAGVGA